MNTKLISVLFVLTFAATAFAQGTSSDKSGGSAKPQLSEIRSLVNALQGQTDKLRQLMEQYRSLVEQRPPGKAHSEELDKWDAALERLLVRIDAAHTTVAETSQRLDQSAKGNLPTSLAKDVANAHNDAQAQRLEAEQVIAKNKSVLSHKGKPEKPAKPADKASPPTDADLDL